jgi:hypothetical protein
LGRYLHQKLADTAGNTHCLRSHEKPIENVGGCPIGVCGVALSGHLMPANGAMSARQANRPRRSPVCVGVHAKSGEQKPTTHLSCPHHWARFFFSVWIGVHAKSGNKSQQRTSVVHSSSPVLLLGRHKSSTWHLSDDTVLTIDFDAGWATDSVKGRIT